MAWTATCALTLYSWWIGGVGYYNLPSLATMRKGLGIESTPAYEMFLGEHPWVFAAAFFLLGVGFIVKELSTQDKRFSVMVTCLCAILLLVVVDVMRFFIVGPLYRLISQLA